MEIRKAELRDLEDIIVLNKIDDYENPNDFISDFIKKGYVHVVLLDDKIIGFSLFELIWGNTPFLALIKIHPDHQKKGIGTKLTEETISIIKKYGFDFCCSSTTECNISARSFHSKLHFIEIGILNLPHGDEIFYRKNI